MPSLKFGAVLKEWRSIRRMSQLDLSSTADVSARHISFLESGRSKPSRSMAIHLAEALDLPRRERNRLLTAAGFAPIWQTRDLSDESMAPVHAAIRWTLDRHNPYPAVVLDRHWNMTDQNQAAATLFAAVGATMPMNFLDEMTGDGHLRQLIDNWGVVGRHMLTRLRTESAAYGGDTVLDDAIDRLSQDPTLSVVEDAMPPVIPIDFRIGETCLSLFSTIAQFGTAEDLALAELRVELFFPADEATRDFLESLA